AVERWAAEGRRGGSGTEARGRGLLDEVLQGLQRARADDLARWLGLDGDLFLREGVDALALLGGGLVDDAQLEEPREDEDSRTLLAELPRDQTRQLLEDAVDLLLAELRLLGDLGDDLRLAHSASGHRALLLE